MTNAQLIICPTCEEKGKKTILGSITEEGHFKLKRFTNGVIITTIKSKEYEIVCMCGFGTIVINAGGQATYV